MSVGRSQASVILRWSQSEDPKDGILRWSLSEAKLGSYNPDSLGSNPSSSFYKALPLHLSLSFLLLFLASLILLQVTYPRGFDQVVSSAHTSDPKM